VTKWQTKTQKSQTTPAQREDSRKSDMSVEHRSYKGCMRCRYKEDSSYIKKKEKEEEKDAYGIPQ
jgi:hypothetical protein